MNHNSNQSQKRAHTLLGLQFISDFGDQITAALLAICILDITNSTSKVGFVYFISTLGFAIFTLVGGMLGDKLSRKRLVVTADAGRAVIVLLMIYALQTKSLPLIYLTSFLLSLLGSFHRPAKISIWTETIPVKHLERFNSLAELSLQLSAALGPLIAGFFVMRALANLGFILDAVSFAFCAICFSLILSHQNSKTASGEKRTGQFLIGFKLIATHNEMLRYVSYCALQMLGYGAFNATFLVLAQRDFGWTKNEYTYHLSIISVGAILGALLGSMRYVERIDPNTKLVACSAISGVALVGILLWEEFPMSSILFGICTALACLTMAVTRTKVQLHAKEFFPESLSSIIAARSVVIKAATLLGTGACIAINNVLSLENTLLLFIFPIALSCTPLFFNPTSRFIKERLPTFNS